MNSQSAGKARLISAGLLFLLLLMSAPLLRAQEAGRFDVFGGFSYLRFNALTIGYPNDANLYGWNLQGTGNIKLKFGVDADISGDYGSQITSYHFMIGPRYTWRRENSNIFVHALFGKAQNNVSIPQPTRSGFESVGRSFGGGIGYDYDWSPRRSWSSRVTVRVVQIDFFHSDTFTKAQNDFRVSTGLVFHFGHIGHRRKL
jgi:hypothetical protein